MRRARLTLPLLSAVLLGTLAAAPAGRAHADTGHVGLVGGAMILDDGGETGFRPHARTEIGFRLWGPFELGGFVQLGAVFPFESPSPGGGVFFQLRPDTALFGFVPHAEVAGARVTLPGADGREDAWSVSVGGGLGYELGAGVVIEARLHHQWYFDLPENGAVGAEGWTVTAGVTYRLP